jgi:hypothetical protein
MHPRVGAMMNRLISWAVMGLVACGGGAGDPGGSAAPTKTSERTSPAESDPHAGHAMTLEGGGEPDAEDPHAGHRMPPAEREAGYHLRLTTDPETPDANTKTRLVFDPRSSTGSRVERLAIVHEKPLHLLVVSRDLAFFAHEHPERQSDGTYALDFAFPEPGEFVLFGDFTPEGAPGQVVRMPVSVAGAARGPRALVVDDRSTAKRFGALAVGLGPEPIRAGAETVLAFTIERDGKPITDLEPYLGALGHCVVIDESATVFLHSHPLEQQGTSSGNVVQFHTVFPTAGRYKVWGQFDVGGEMLVADFVVEVVAGEATSAAEPHAEHPH